MIMSNQWQHNILGMGGKKPGIAVYSRASGSPKRILSLPGGHDVYAVDVSADGKVIFVGTESGAIYRLTQQEGLGSGNYQAEQLATGCVSAPVLSVCFLDEKLAASDTAARCQLYGPGATPERLPTGRRTIASVFPLNDRLLGGLSLGGEVIIWDHLEGQIVQIVEVPCPPEDLAALVRTVYWPAADRWVWPGRGGVIVFYSWSKKEVRSIAAHSSEAYAMVVCNDELVTMGTDGSVQRWSGDSDEPVASARGPEGIISAALCYHPEDFTTLLLINNKGKVGIYSWADGQLEFGQWLNGQDCLVVLGPDIQKVQSAIHQQKATRARELSVQIRQIIARGEQGSALDNHYQQLVQLGYEPVSLALRAEECRSKNDLVSELKYYKKLSELAPQTDERTKSSILRYAVLLETVWQPQRASVIYRQLAQRYVDNNGYAESMCRASKYASIIEGGEYAIEADVPLESLIKSAMVLGETFTGRYLLKKIEVPINCNVIISAGDLVEKYEQIIQTRPQESLPRARQTELWWLSKNKTEQVTTVILKGEDSGPFSRLEVGVRVLDARLQTVLIPVVMFNADQRTKGESPEQHNQAVLEQLERITKDSSLSKGWLDVVYGNLRDAFRQLITRGLAGKTRQSGANRNA